MRGCGTQFIDEPGYDVEALNQIERLAMKYEAIARQLKATVEKCKASNTTEGLDEMVAYSFNAQQYQPNYGSGGGGLPVGQHKVVIVNSEAVTTKDSVTQQVKGGYMAFHLTPIEGPYVGQTQIDRLNLHHTNPKVVEIANEQLSAYCHVLGKFSFNDTAELHNIPFIVEIGYQKGQEPTQEKPNGGYTEVKKIFDVNGNEPGKAGSGPQPGNAPGAGAPPPQQPPAGGVAPQGAPPAAWGAPGGQPPAQPPQDQQQPPAQPPAGQGAWGGAPAGQQPPAQPPAGGQAWGAPPAGQGAPPAAWGGPPAA